MAAGFRVFLSAATAEFGAARDAVANDLQARDLQVRVQRSFRKEPGADTLLRWRQHSSPKGDDLDRVEVNSSAGPIKWGWAVRRGPPCVEISDSCHGKPLGNAGKLYTPRSDTQVRKLLITGNIL